LPYGYQKTNCLSDQGIQKTQKEKVQDGSKAEGRHSTKCVQSNQKKIMAKLSEQQKQRLLRNAIILRTGKFYDASSGKLKDATDKQMSMAAQILRRDGQGTGDANKRIREFRAKQKGFGPAYFAKAEKLRQQFGVPSRKGKPRRGLTGMSNSPYFCG
jgi:hypothetical protein